MANAKRSSTATVELVAKAGLAETFAIATPLTPVGFYPRFGPLPEVLEVRNQTGAWDAPGQSRQLMLSGDGSVTETTTDVHAPDFFAYELSRFDNVFGRIVSGARAEWRFRAVDGGTSIRWSYTFYPLAGRRWIIAAIVGNLWAPYMRKVLPGIVAEVERVASAAN
jgi:hypothetical protein